MNDFRGAIVLLIAASVLSGCTGPMLRAIRENRTDRAVTLIGRGADVNAKTEEVVRAGNREVKILGVTPLMLAAKAGDIKVVQALLDKGARVNDANSVGGTALMRAVLYSHTDVAKLLLEHGANPNVANIDGATPLLMAVWAKDTAVAGALLDHGANPDDRDKANLTALMLASCRGTNTRSLDMVRTLVEHKANLEAPSASHRVPRSGRSLLRRAVVCLT